MEQQRRLVLDAARAVFARDGYGGATVERVARAAGIPRSSVYELFDGKQELFAAVVADAGESLVRHMTVSFRESQHFGLRDYVRHNYASAFDLFERHRDAVTVLLQAERAGVGPTTEVAGDMRQRVLAQLADSTRARWEELGLGAEVAAANEMLSLMFLRMTESVAAYHAGHRESDRDALVDLLTDFTLGGLARLSRHAEVLAAVGRCSAENGDAENGGGARDR